jgi:hypothetical protein
MRVILTQAVVVVALSAAAPPANAQGTTSTNRSAGSDFSVTTGIGSSATVTTHKVEPGPPRGGSSIDGLDQSLPDDDQGKPNNSKLDSVKPVDTGARSVPSSSGGPNAIARDRVESPQDK